VLGGAVTGAGSATFTKAGGLALTLDAAASIATPFIVVQGGRLQTAVAGQLVDTPIVTVGSGSELAVAAAESVESIALAGTLSGAGPLSAVTLTTSGTATITTAATATTSATIGGTLTIGGAGGRLTSPLIDITGGATLTSTAASTDHLGNTSNVRVGSGATLSLAAAEVISSLALSGTLGGTGSLTASGAATLTSGAVNATLNAATITSSGVSSIDAVATATGAASVTGDTLMIGGLGGVGQLNAVTLGLSGNAVLQAASGNTDRIGNGAAVSVASGATLSIGNSSEQISSLGLSGTLAGTGALATSGASTVTGGTVDTTLSAATIDISGASAINAGATAAGAATITGGTLQFGGAGGRLTAGAGGIGISGGAIVSVDTSTRLVAPSLAIDSGTLRITGSGVALNGFSVGSGGAIVDTNGSAAGLDLSVSGSGGATFTKAGAGTLTVGAAGSIDTPNILVNEGTLATAAANRLGNGSAVQVLNGSRLTLGGADTVASLVLAGTLDGAGPLTAATISSNGASSLRTGATATGSASVTAGTLTITDAGGRLAAPTIVVTGTGVLATAASSADRIADTAALNVGSTAGLAIGNTETIASLALAGTLSGSGLLTTSGTTALNGGTVGAQLQAASITSTGASRIQALATAPTATVSDGTLTLADASGRLAAPSVALTGTATLVSEGGANDRLLNTAAVTVGSTAVLSIANAEQIGSLALANRLEGSGTLTAATLSTSGNAAIEAAAIATTSANVASGTLTIGGANGRLTSPAIGVGGGATLVTASGSADRLGDAAAVTVGSTAVLSVGNSEAIASLALSGSLQGSGTLRPNSAALSGGTVDARLEAGTLDSSGTSTINAAAASATRATVNGGTLTIGTAGRLNASDIQVDAGTLVTTAAQQLSDSTRLRVANAATVQLGGDETIGALTDKTGETANGSARVMLAGHALTVDGPGASTAASFGGAISGAAGSLVKRGNGTLTLTGANTYSGVTRVEAGTLATVGANRLAAAGSIVVDDAGTLVLGAAQTTATLALAGTLSGPGPLTATASASVSGGQLGTALATPVFTSSGASSVSAAVAAGTTATVTDGTLTLAAGGSLASPSIVVAAGTLRTTSAESLGDASQVSVAPGAVLQVGAGETIDRLLLGGTLSGPGGLTASTSAALEGARIETALATGVFTSTGASTLAAAVQASSQATVLGGTLAVAGGASLAAPTIAVAAGAELRTAAANALGDASALQVATGGTLRLGAAETIDTLALSGLLAGPGALTASTAAALDGGTVATALETPLFTSTGASSVTAPVTATGSATLLGGTLTLSGSGRLLGPSIVLSGGSLISATGSLLDPTSALRIGAGATLRLDENQTVATLTLGGTLEGAGLLTAGVSAALEGGALAAALATPTLTSSGDSVATAAITASGSATVQSGSLTLAAGGRLTTPLLNVAGGTLATTTAGQLAGVGAVQVAAGAALDFAAAEQAASLSLAGTLGGTGSFAADRIALDGGTLRVGTTAGTLTSRGDSRVDAAAVATSSATVQAGLLTIGSNGTLASPSVVVEGGTLATAGADRIGDAAALRVGSGAAVQLGGSETVDALTLAGTLAGPGDLRVLSATALDGGSVQTALATTTLVSSGTSTIAAPVQAGTSASVLGGALSLAAGGSLSAPLLGVAGGTLATSAAGQLAGSGELSVAPGAGVLLGGAETVATLALRGSLGGAGSLAAASATLDGGTVNAPLSAGTLTSTGDSTLHAASTAGSTATVTGGTLRVAADGALAAPLVVVQGGTLATEADDRIATTAALQVGNGATLQLGGSQSAASLADLAGQAADGSARVQLGTHRLAVGSGNADTTFTGILAGSGSLDKQGTGTFTLLGANTYGDTLVTAGTLQIGASGSLGTGGVANQGVLRFQRGDAVQLDNLLSGSGMLEQAGSGTLTLANAGNSYSGETRVTSGVLQTAGSERLPDTSSVTVAAGASLRLAGNESVRSITGAGTFDLAGSVTTTGEQNYGGAVTVSAAQPITLSAAGQPIEAASAGNNWGSQPLSVSAGQLVLSSGQEAGVFRDLTLGAVTLDGSGASRIDAGRIVLGSTATTPAGDPRLDGLLRLAAGTLELQAHAAPTYALVAEAAAVDPLTGKRPIHVASDVIAQGPNSQVDTAAGSLLLMVADAGGSITLDQLRNVFAGSVSALSGTTFGQAWADNAANPALDTDPARQSAIVLGGQEVLVGGQGLDADMIRITAGRLGTDFESNSVIRARLWYNDDAFGTTLSTPGLRLTLLEPAFETEFSFGSTDRPINVNVGATDATAPRAGLSAGFVQVLPKEGARGATAVYLLGPTVAPGLYSFFHDGAALATEIPVLYNRVLPATPQLSGSLSAVASVSETARKERFEEAVRTENVAARLRAGVIAEVGPGRPATQGTEGIRLPPGCTPQSLKLRCD
jgi:autotransporter-associated beta strand protein